MMTLKWSSSIRHLAEIDEQLATDVREALKLKVDLKVREHLTATLEQLREALQSTKQRRISGAIKTMRTVVHEVIAVAANSTLMHEEKGKASDAVEFDEWPSGIPTRAYLCAFEKGAGQKLEQMNPKDFSMVSYIVASARQQRSPGALFADISRKILGSSASAKGKRLCIHIRNGKTPDEAKRLVEEVEQANEVNQEYLLIFQKSARRRLEQMNTTDVMPVTFTIGSVKQQRSPGALFTSVSVKVFDERAQAKGRQLCIYIRDGMTEAEAKRLVEEEEQASEVIPAYLHAFEKGAKRTLEEMDPKDSSPVTFTIGSVRQQRSPSSLFQAIAKGNLLKNAPAKGRQLCIYIRDGMTEAEAKRLVEEEEQASEVIPAYLHAFEKGAKRTLEEMDPKDSSPVTFTIGSVRQQRSPSSLFQAIAKGNLLKNAPAKGRQLCIYIRDGMTEAEAKRLVEEEEQASEVIPAYLHAFEKGAKR